MREILFRGKRIDNGEWLEGYYGFDDNKPLIAINKANGINGYFVAAETVGQYTGLTDKNGKKIFEGDIVKCRIVDAMLIKTSGGNVKTEFIGPVKYINGSFYIVTNSNEELEVRAVFEEDYIWEAEVIGNIYDNPELLEDKPDD